ncbi:MAG: PD-(D/E)XK nuclease family protein [Thermoplasmata archaeon]
MGLPALSPLLLAAAVAAIGLGLAWVAVRGLLARREDRRFGTLVGIDAGEAVVLRSARYRLIGRPDVLRRLPDGRVVPVEVKSRTTPRDGPPPSHVAQVRAYCLLVEETTGATPPFGVLRYADGGEFRVRWDSRARAQLIALRAAVDRTYDGRATPSRSKCAHCPWRAVCDARAAGT